jgi:hypothetical protein
MTENHVRSTLAFALQQWGVWKKEIVIYQRFQCNSVKLKNSPLKNTKNNLLDIEGNIGN